jgi:hypothetical protein
MEVFDSDRPPKTLTRLDVAGPQMQSLNHPESATSMKNL